MRTVFGGLTMARAFAISLLQRIWGTGSLLKALKGGGSRLVTSLAVLPSLMLDSLRACVGCLLSAKAQRVAVLFLMVSKRIFAGGKPASLKRAVLGVVCHAGIVALAPLTKALSMTSVSPLDGLRPPPLLSTP